jgi:putative ABC transport system ATP-binding protein
MGTVLKLENLTKTYIIGNRKNALKAQRAIQKRQDSLSPNKLQRIQDLFAAEEYEASFEEATGRRLRPRPKDRGTVVNALRGVDLEIQGGELVAVMGPSGSGKSTLLNMLGLLDQPTSGRMWVNGRSTTSIRTGDLPEIRSHELGFVFQSFNLITTLTALENVMLPLRYAGIGASKRHQMAREALERVGLGDRMSHSPNELSGGQQQRVAIARSIVNHPSIILADELTGELDSKMTAEVMGLILELNHQGQTFVIVTHNPDVARLCRRVVHMQDGCIDHVETARKHPHQGTLHLPIGRELRGAHI